MKDKILKILYKMHEDTINREIYGFDEEAEEDIIAKRAEINIIEDIIDTIKDL